MRLFSIALGFVWLCFPVAVSVGAEPQRPNVLVILADDLGRGDYSAFGTKDLRTPHIDRLVREGMTLDNFYANSCVCSPTRAALLSGCYPDRVGVPGVIRYFPEDSWGYLDPHARLLPRLLKPAGYHSAIVGKWHLGLASPNTPTEHGFDFFHGFLGDMMDDYWTHRRHDQNFMRLGQETIDPEGHATDLFSQWACDYLKDRSGKQEPFFLYLAYNAPHGPLQPPPDWLERVQKREPGMAKDRAKLVALIEHLDAGIGRVLDALDEHGHAERTLVIFTSDNGGVHQFGANNGPWRSGKTHMYEGGLRVPFAARWPGKIEPGKRNSHAALSMDIFATVLEAAGIERPATIDGVSFLAELVGRERAAAPRDLYFVRREGGLMYGGETITALRHGDWKLLQDSPFAPLELYNLRDDPQETTDLAGRQRKVVAELDSLLRRQIQRGGSVAWQPPGK